MCKAVFRRLVASCIWICLVWLAGAVYGGSQSSPGVVASRVRTPGVVHSPQWLVPRASPVRCWFFWLYRCFSKRLCTWARELFLGAGSLFPGAVFGCRHPGDALGSRPWGGSRALFWSRFLGATAPGTLSGAASRWQLQVQPLGSLEPLLEAVSHDYIKRTWMFSKHSRIRSHRIQIH